MKTRYYQCSDCHRIHVRVDNKKRIKSYCDETDKNAMLIRIDNKEKMIEGFRKRHLPHLVELKTFNKKERGLMKIAFEQGATVMFNAFN